MREPRRNADFTGFKPQKLGFHQLNGGRHSIKQSKMKVQPTKYGGSKQQEWVERQTFFLWQALMPLAISWWDFTPNFGDFTSSVTDLCSWIFLIKIETIIKHWDFHDFSLSRTGIQHDSTIYLEEQPVEGRFVFGSSSPSQGLNFWGFRKPTESSPSTNQSSSGFEPTGMGQKLSAFVKR